MDLSPDQLALLAAIVHGDDGKLPVFLAETFHGPALRDFDARGLITARAVDSPCAAPPCGLLEVWLADQPRPTVTLTPFAAKWLGLELAERMRLEKDEFWEECDSEDVGGYNRAENLVVRQYWARVDRTPDEPRLIVDDPAFGHVPSLPRRAKEPERAGEKRMSMAGFPDDVIIVEAEQRAVGRPDRGKARRAG